MENTMPMVIQAKWAIRALVEIGEPPCNDQPPLRGERADAMWQQEATYLFGCLSGVVSALSITQSSKDEIASALSGWFEKYLAGGPSVLSESLASGLGAIRDTPRLRHVAECLGAMSELLPDSDRNAIQRHSDVDPELGQRAVTDLADMGQ